MSAAPGNNTGPQPIGPYVRPFQQSESQVPIGIPDEMKHKEVTVRMRCFDYMEYMVYVINRTVYPTRPSPKFVSLVGLLNQVPRPPGVFYYMLRHIAAVLREADSNFSQVLNLAQFSRYTWNILDLWTDLEDPDTPDDKVLAAVILLVVLRNVLTSKHLLSKQYVDPEFYSNCIQILEKFTFHPVAYLRKTATKELKKLRRAYSIRIEDKQLEKQISRKAIEKLCHFINLRSKDLAAMLVPWMGILSTIASCGMAEIEMFCFNIVKRLFEISHIQEPVFEALNLLFAQRMNDLPWACIEAVTTEMYGLHSKYVQSPAIFFTRTVVKWLIVMQEAYIHASRLHVSETCEAMPKIFRAVAAIEEKKTEFMSSPEDSVDEAIFETYRTLFEQIVGPVCESKDLAARYAPQLSECFEIVASDLHATRHKAQDVFAIMIDSASQNGADLWTKHVRDFEILGHMGIGAAIRVLGPEVVLRELPLQGADGSLNFNRMFMVALLKDNIRASSIDFFLDTILPLARECQKLAEQDGPNSVAYKSAGDQILELLPCFCAAAPDLEANFKHIASLINDLIQNDKSSLRTAGLMALIKCLLNATISKKPEVLDAVRKYDTHFLSILYDLYLTEPIDDQGEAQRLTALECLKLLFAMSKTALTKEAVLAAVNNLNIISDDPKMAFVKRSIVQLFITLLPWLNCQMIRVIYAEYLQHLPTLEREDEQKDAYRLLKRICSYPKHGGSKKFVATNKKKLNSLLWDCLNRPFLFNDRRARFKLLVYLVMAQPHSNPRGILIGMVVREALSTLNVAKSVKEKNLACDALISVFRDFLLYKEVNLFLSMIAFNLFIPEPDRDNIKAEILAVTCIYRNFSDELGPKNVQLLINAIINAMNVPTVAVVTAGLTFLRVYFSVMPGVPTSHTLTTIFQILSALPHNMKVFFRKLITIAFAELLKKCKLEDLFDYVPASDRFLYDLLMYAHGPIGYPRNIRATRDEFNHVTEPDEFLPKATRLEDILTDSDFSDDEDCATSKVDFDEALNRDSDSEDDDDISSCRDEYVISEPVKGDDKENDCSDGENAPRNPAATDGNAEGSVRPFGVNNNSNN